LAEKGEKKDKRERPKGSTTGHIYRMSDDEGNGNYNNFNHNGGTYNDEDDVDTHSEGFDMANEGHEVELGTGGDEDDEVDEGIANTGIDLIDAHENNGIITPATER
jgi:hypothetical protein